MLFIQMQWALGGVVECSFFSQETFDFSHLPDCLRDAGGSRKVIQDYVGDSILSPYNLSLLYIFYKKKKFAYSNTNVDYNIFCN